MVTVWVWQEEMKTRYVPCAWFLSWVKEELDHPKSERRQEQPDVGGALIYLFAVDKKVAVQGSVDGG